jgi:hypothetical protein
MRGTGVIVDFDFALGRNHLRGTGWRGLTALAILLTLRAAVLVIIAVSAQPMSVWLFRLLQQALDG